MNRKLECTTISLIYLQSKKKFGFTNEKSNGAHAFHITVNRKMVEKKTISILNTRVFSANSLWIFRNKQNVEACAKEEIERMARYLDVAPSME